MDCQEAQESILESLFVSGSMNQGAGSRGSRAFQKQRFVQRGQRLKRGVRTPAANTGGVPVGSVEHLQRGVRYGTITERINGAPVAALTVGFIPGLLRETGAKANQDGWLVHLK